MDEQELMMLIKACDSPWTPARSSRSQHDDSWDGSLIEALDAHMGHLEESNNKHLKRQEISSRFGEKLSDFGLPSAVCRVYEEKGVKKLYPWQQECLSREGVAEGLCNLVYSAPTSGGKTLCAEVLMLKRVLEWRCKALFIVPTASLAEEKAKSFEKMFSSIGLRVEGFFRSQGVGMLESDSNGGADIGVCTIEKAHHLINRLFEKKGHTTIGAVIVDEAHMIGHAERGSLLEGIIAKIKYWKTRCQIICMSATLPNLSAFRGWIDAVIYETTFRPVPLCEYLFHPKEPPENVAILAPVPRDIPMPLTPTEQLRPLPVPKSSKFDQVLVSMWSLISDAVCAGKSVLIFTGSRKSCENLAKEMAQMIKFDEKMRMFLECDSTKEGLRSLSSARISRSVGGPNPSLQVPLMKGIAYHHAGLTSDERGEVEKGYRSGFISVLIATSTLAIGVNLPAGRVIFHSFHMGRNLLSCTEYLQMAGRAGRAGIDSLGEAFIFVSRKAKASILERIRGPPMPLQSALALDKNSVSRFLLDIAGRGIVETRQHLEQFIECTLWWCLCEDKQALQRIVDEALGNLHRYFTFDQTGRIRLDVLAIAASTTWLSPEEAIALKAMLELAGTRGIVMLNTNLHLIYLLTPLNPEPSRGHTGRDSPSTLTGEQVRALLVSCRSNEAERNVLTKVFGSEEAVAYVETRFSSSAASSMDVTKRRCMERLFCAKVMCEILKEQDFCDVSKTFQVEMSFIQSLLELTSANASLLPNFLDLLGGDFKRIGAVLAEFAPQLERGVNAELVDLMQIPKMSRVRARALFEEGIKDLKTLAETPVNQVYEVLVKCKKWRIHKIDAALAEVIERKAAKKMVKEAINLLRSKDDSVSNADVRRKLLEDARMDQEDRQRKKTKIK